MILLKLAYKSILNRFFSTSLTIISIALSVALLLAVERTKRAAEEGFTQSISQTDLLVGARTGPLNLILYTVFNMGSATNNISWKSYQDIKSRSDVDWTIPYSLGDGHKGFRVVATDENFYKHYHFHGDHSVQLIEGHAAVGIWDAVIGSEVAKKLKYKVGDRIVLAHGVTRTEGLLMHEDKPFRITGLLKSTGTAIDQSVYISLYGMEALHIDWKNGAAPTAENKASANRIRKEDIKFSAITAFFLRTRSRIETLKLQRDINTYEEEPLLAIIPGVTLSELWRGLSQIDQVLKAISWMVIGVGIAAMLSSLMASLNERRREMAILRALGSSGTKIIGLLVLESILVTLTGLFIGALFEVASFFLLQDWLQNQFGLLINGSILSSTDILYLCLIALIGLIAGLIPAYRALNSALKDGLSVRI